MTDYPTTSAGLSGTNLERAADYNQRVILQAIRVSEAATRAELARATGLTAPAVANITKRLMLLGLVAEADKLHGGRGQPATRLVIPPDGCFSLGLNIDRDHCTVVLLDLLGSVRGRLGIEGRLASPAATAALMGDMLRDLLASAGVDATRLIGAGVVLPDALGLTALPALHPFSEWAGLDVATLFGDAVAEAVGRRLPIYVENDAAAAAIGELQFGLGLRHSSFFYMLISAGLGGGLVVDGDYFRGANGRSGEIGFFPIHSELTRARTLQDLVSLSALIAYLADQGVTIGAPSELADLNAHGERMLQAWLETAAELLTEPLLTVSCLINPAAILIGGRLPGHLVDRLAERLTDNLYRRGGPGPDAPVILRAALAEDAPALGAAILPFLAGLLPSRANLFKIGE
jgi:predicted NBD/HSP70 family sugar kinase